MCRLPVCRICRLSGIRYIRIPQAQSTTKRLIKTPFAMLTLDTRLRHSGPWSLWIVTRELTSSNPKATGGGRAGKRATAYASALSAFVQNGVRSVTTSSGKVSLDRVGPGETSRLGMDTACFGVTVCCRRQQRSTTSAWAGVPCIEASESEIAKHDTRTLGLDLIDMDDAMDGDGLRVSPHS